MGYYSTTIQKGSNGYDVKQWQEFLSSQGYDFSAYGGIDGIFGDATDKYTRDWQAKNGIGVDGIVGKTTWGKAGFSDINTPISAPTMPNLEYTKYEDTTEGGAKKTALEAALESINGYGDHNWANEDIYNEWLNKKLNREDFSYDLNADSLYKQYAEQYRNMGKMASADVMGQAAAMTGGYGNSYAATAGNQAYQAYLGKLNDIIPELYQMALNKYTMEGEEIDSNIAALINDYSKSFDEWQTGYGLLKDKYDIANSDYYNSASLYGTEQDTLNSIAQQKYTNAWNQAQWDEGIRQSELERYLNEQANTGSLITTGGSGGSGGGSGSGSGSGSGGGTATHNWTTFDQKTLEKNQIEKGGSYYTTARSDIDKMINSGSSYETMTSYVKELLDNSYLSQHEYMTLVQYIRNNYNKPTTQAEDDDNFFDKIGKTVKQAGKTIAGWFS